uniref:Xylulose kinase-1 n=1 Tax=Tanacetum cinerariifolium TaxID=118510 RepID=A0A6L2KKY5_TANCI|nr:hypothetical protein [Tanacetum cinerariifolium]
MSLTFTETHNIDAYLSKSDASEGFNQIIDFLNGRSIKYALTVNPNIYVSCIKQFWTTVAVKQVNVVTRLQALVDKKKCMSAKRTSCNEFSSSMASAIICLSLGDADEHVEEVHTAEGDDSAAHGEVPAVTEEPSIPSPTPPTLPPQTPQDIPSTSQVQQTPPQSPQLKGRVKKLEKRNKVRVLKLRRLQRVGTSQRVDTSDDTVMDDESNQGRMIAEMYQDDAVVLKDDKEEDKEVADKDVEEAKEDEIEPAEVQKVVDVITTAKLITEVVNAASETVTAAKDENKALQTINETPAEKAAKRRKLNEEVEDLKRHLQIVPNEDDDVYTEATPLARKVPVMDYEIIEINNKPYYKIIRSDARCTCLNLKESKNCTWLSKGQELEVIGIMWYAYHNLYNHTVDFVSGKKNLVLPSKVNAAEAKLMLLRQINAAKDKLMLSRQS